MNSMHIKKGDMVIINTGVDKGKKGKVLAASPKNQKIVVEGINEQSKHKKAKNAKDKAGIVTINGPISATNANLICGKCSKPTRVAHSIDKDGKKIRICKKCGAEIK